MDSLHLNFVSQATIHTASHRMRVLKPCELLNTKTPIEATISPKADPKANINVFSKHFDQQQNIIGIHSGPDLGYYTVFDVCDDHFDREFGKYYEAMCNAADMLTCNTKKMQERIYEVTGKLARIVPDPSTFPQKDPLIGRRELPKILWFGHSSNLQGLHDNLSMLGTRSITVISDKPLNAIHVESLVWKPNLVESLIGDFDIVFLPTTGEPHTKTKSPNRAMDAIMSGKLVVTNDKDIYGEFAGMGVAFVNSKEDFDKVVEFYQTDAEGISQIIKKGQEYIKEHYNDSVVLEGWLNVLKDLNLLKGFQKVALNG